MTSTSPSQCPQCGAAISDDANGLCPRCVFAKAMMPTAGVDVASLLPPDLEAVRVAFPQLEVLSLIGSGGMGAVFKARQPQLDRFVALKILPVELATQPGFAERFQREARALAKLSHPHIVAVHDFGQAGEFYFLVMEFVDGVNLRQLLQTKRLTPKEALSIVPPICEALQCAHDHGIVHRDIKPENLLIDKAGVVKIADFGIAKIYGSHLAPRDEQSATADTDNSRPAETLRFGESTGLISRSEMATLGTPDYAAPEQAKGSVDHRADIYSLGVVLYEMLTGERPTKDFVQPSKRVQVDVRIDEIVLRALEAKPELRFATVTEFRTQLEACAVDDAAPRSETLVPPAQLSDGMGSVAVTVGLVLLLSGGALQWLTRSQLGVFEPFMLPVFGLIVGVVLRFLVRPWWVLARSEKSWQRVIGMPFFVVAWFLVGLIAVQFGISLVTGHGSAGLLVLGLVLVGLAAPLIVHWSFQTRARSRVANMATFVIAAVVAIVWVSLKHPTETEAITARAAEQKVATVQSNTDLMNTVKMRIAAFHQGQPDNNAVVKVVYFHGQDREPWAGYESRVVRVLTDVSDFYRDGLSKLGVESKGVPFERDASGKIELRVVRGKEPTSRYDYSSGDDTWAEVKAALGAEIEGPKDHVLILYALCEKARDGRYVFNAPYDGAGWSDHRHGLCHAADCELLDPQLLTAQEQPMVFTEHYYPRKELSVAEFNSWYLGGIAHELGHAFGLPHDSGSPEEASLGTSLMGTGNLNYREEKHGGKAPAYLSLASAIRLAAHPLFTRSDKARWDKVQMGPYVIHAHVDGQALVLAGRLKVNVPACAAIASVWSASAQDGMDHEAQTFCSAVDDEGQFNLRIPSPGDGRWNLKLGTVLLNGAEPHVFTTFDVMQGRLHVDDLVMKLQVDVVEQVLLQSPTEAPPMLTDEAIAAVGSEEAQRSLKLLQAMTKPEPEPIDLSTTTLTRAFVSDARWSFAEVGWGKVMRNRWGAEAEYGQGLLLKLGGTVHAKGLYAHARSRYEFPLGGRWKKFSAKVGLRDGAPEFGSAVFIIEGDGVELVRSSVLSRGMSEAINIDVTGIKTLTLRANGSEHGSWAIWCEPIVER